jgi:DNA-binding CsgD family transcriptional regulator
VLDGWPLLGRNAEIDRVRQVWRSGPAGVVVAGPCGSGKTAFAHACLDLARDLGWNVEVISTPAASATLWGADLLSSVLDGLSASGEAAVVFVDDVELLSDAPAALLHDAALRRGIGVLATLRSGTVAASAITDLWRNGVATRIDLVPLGVDLIGQIMTTVLGGPVEHATVAACADLCQGNGSYLRELLIGARDDGTLSEAHGLWRLTDEIRPSCRLIELVESELAGVSAVERRVLETVAYAGALSATLVEQLFGSEDAGRLERSGHLTSRRTADGIEFGLRHQVHREILRAGLSAADTHDIAARLVRVTTRAADAGVDCTQVAAWGLDAGTTTPAELLAAATTARWRYDFPLAERLVTGAVRAGAGFDAELLAAQLASLQGKAEEADRRLHALQDRAVTDNQRGRAAVSRLDNIALYQGDIDLGLRVAEDAERSITDREWRDHVSGVKVAMLLAARGPRAAARAAEPLLESATGLGLVRACGGAAYSFGRTGQLEKALRASQLGYAAHRELDEPTDWYPWFNILTRCMTLAQAGRFAEADRDARQQHARGVAETSPEAQAYFSWHLVKVVGERGHITDAVHHGREALTLFRELGRPQYVREAQVALALALALAGRGREADALLQEQQTLGVPGGPYTAVELPIARGWTLAALGDLSGAVGTLRSGADLATDLGDLVGAASALHAVARLGHADEVLDELAAVTSAVEGELAPARLAHTRALVAGDPAGLREATAAFESMGADLLAAEAAADLVVALSRSGRRRDCNAAHRRATELAARCPGASTPALRRLELAARLTRSEYEVALLAAGGATNGAIADHLSLSIRTVQNHLQRAYDKLGIHARGDLGAALHGSPADARATQAGRIPN